MSLKQTSKSIPIKTSPHPVVEMRGITKHFPGVFANDRVDLALYPGEVLALLGENGAGKSTLMNILAGLYRPDEGTIAVHGKTVDIHSPRDAAVLGIGMVHQNFMLVDTMTAAENIILGMRELPLIPDIDAVSRRIQGLSERYGLRVDPGAAIWQLSVGEQQRVEILKLVYRGADIFILDEPTAVLTPQEADELNSVIRNMVAEGKSAVFITHKMDEVMSFSNRVEVLRKGKVVSVQETRRTNPQELAKMMVGREVLFRIDRHPCETGDVVLRMMDVYADDNKGNRALRGISLEIPGGEILGIAGVAGNGQRELAETITGLREVSHGKIEINGKDMTNRTPLDIIRAGVSHVPADRIAMGVVGTMSVANNLAMKGYRKPPLAHTGFIRPRRILELALRLIEAFHIDTPGPQTEVKYLSGGNIQKTILAREIESCSGLLVAGYPSRGLDVGATEAVRRRLIEQRDSGRAVLLISEDLEELLTVADRIAVLFEGRIMGILDRDSADVQTLGLMMAGMEEAGEKR